MIPGVRRPCVVCGTLVDTGSRCQQHAIPDLYRGDWARRSRAVRQSATTCYWCRESFTAANPVQADHLIPGDPHSPLVPACRRCNAGRGR